jgi:ABC-type lipoprotein release transport system permease subunit
MENIKGKPKKQSTTIKYASFILFLSLIILVISLISQNRERTEIIKNTTNSSVSPTGTSQNSSEEDWEKYTDEKYGFEVLIPRLLLEKKYENTNSYNEFIVFYQNQYSRGKGVAIGVSDKDLQSEMDIIKEELNKEGNAQLTKQSILTLHDDQGVRLDYEPEDISSGDEKRSIIIIHHGKYSYSFSTVPDQIEAVVSTLQFTE